METGGEVPPTLLICSESNPLAVSIPYFGNLGEKKDEFMNGLGENTAKCKKDVDCFIFVSCSTMTVHDQDSGVDKKTDTLVISAIDIYGRQRFILRPYKKTDDGRIVWTEQGAEKAVEEIGWIKYLPEGERNDEFMIESPYLVTLWRSYRLNSIFSDKKI